MALRPDTEDESRPSIERIGVSNVNFKDERPKERKSWKEKHHGASLRERFAQFPWKPFVLVSLLPLALVPIVLLASLAEIASTGYIQNRSCYPNGLWSQARGATWRIMDSSYFFTPNLSFGSMTYTAAKIIDISWDLVIGRGGQILLACVNYRVFNEWLLYHMEMHLTSYKMYTTVAFQTTSLSTLGVLGKEFLAFGENTWRRFFRWLALLCMMLSTLYVLSFPTLMGAMTGYNTTYKAYVQDSQENLIEFAKYLPVRWVIWDSERIGNYTKPLVATEGDVNLIKAIETYINSTSNASVFYTEMRDYTAMIRGDVVASLNESSEWNLEGIKKTLNAPTLNITWFETGQLKDYSPRIHYDFYAYDGRQGDVYSYQWLLQTGSCKPGETYQWGFSYIFLFMVSIFNFVWSCIMVGMWLDISKASRMYKSGRRPGLLKSVLDISEAIRDELGDEADKLEEEELGKALTRSGGALLVPAKELKVARTGNPSLETGVRKRSWMRNLTKGSTF